MKNIKADFDHNKSFSGLFAAMTKSSKVNPHMAGSVRVTSSGTSQSSTKKAHDIICPFGKGDWVSNNAPNAFIQIDFRNYLYQPTYYSINFFSMNSQCLIKSWFLEGSVDGAVWFCMDEERIQDSKQENIISCGLYSEIPVRFVRMGQIGKNISGNNIMSLHQIEFFGELIFDSKAPLRLPSAGFI